MILAVWLENNSLGDAIAALPWIVDGLSNDDFGYLLALLEFARATGIDSTLVTELFNNALGGDLGRHLSTSLQNAWIQDRAAYDQLLALPWVADGLNEEEAAFLVPLAKISNGYSLHRSHQELRDGYYVQSRVVTLPLRGEVQIWVFSNDPFGPTDDWLAVLENSIRVMEQFLGRAFPTSNVILLIEVVRGDVVYLSPGSNYQHSIWIADQPNSSLPVVHEAAHYYFWGRPNWLSEGGSDFMESYIAAQQGVQGLNDRTTALMGGELWHECVSELGVENLLHLTSRRFITACDYVMGEHFLLQVLDAIGSEALGAALRELHWHSPSEQQIYDTLLKHTPPESREAFLEAYGRLHGGPTLPNTPDDHGDDQASATPLSLGQPVTGALDYRFDLDFFSFQAEGGQKYSITVRHDDLRPSSLGLYSSNGTPLRNDVRHDLHQVASGLELRWEPPRSGVYYVSVENFAGESGTYTLTVTAV